MESMVGNSPAKHEGKTRQDTGPLQTQLRPQIEAADGEDISRRLGRATERPG